MHPSWAECFDPRVGRDVVEKIIVMCEQYSRENRGFRSTVNQSLGRWVTAELDDPGGERADLWLDGALRSLAHIERLGVREADVTPVRAEEGRGAPSRRFWRPIVVATAHVTWGLLLAAAERDGWRERMREGVERLRATREWIDHIIGLTSGPTQRDFLWHRLQVELIRAEAEWVALAGGPVDPPAKELTRHGARSQKRELRALRTILSSSPPLDIEAVSGLIRCVETTGYPHFSLESTWGPGLTMESSSHAVLQCAVIDVALHGELRMPRAIQVLRNANGAAS